MLETTEDNGTEDVTPPRRRTPLLIGGLFIALAAILVVWLLLPGTPTDASPEAGFAREMGTHHAQAEQMSFIVRDKTDDEDVRSLAYDIIRTQAAQRGIMMGWLQQWGLPQSGDPERPPMSWAGGHHGGSVSAGPMPGLATKKELGELKESEGEKAEVIFLQLMIKHHVGGVDMAKAVVTRTDRDEVRRLAQGMIEGQQSEIKVMTEMLEERDAKPLSSP